MKELTDDQKQVWQRLTRTKTEEETIKHLESLFMTTEQMEKLREQANERS